MEIEEEEEKPRNLEEVVARVSETESVARKVFEKRYEEIVTRIRLLYTEQPYLEEAIRLFAETFKHVETVYCYDRQFQQPMYWIILSPRPVTQLDHVVGYYYQTTPLNIRGFEFPTYVILYFDSNYVSPGEMERIQKVLRDSATVFEAIKETISAMVVSLKEAWHIAEYHQTYSTTLINILGKWKKGIKGLEEQFGQITIGEKPRAEQKSKWLTYLPLIGTIVSGIIATIAVILALL